MENEYFFRNYLTIKYPHRLCHFPSEDPYNIIDIASDMVKEVLCTAEEFIGEDMAEVFYYKFPKNWEIPPQANSVASWVSHTSSISIDKNLHLRNKDYYDYNDRLSDTQSILPEVHKGDIRYPDDIEWPTIDRFNLRDCAGQIRDYIELWKLAPNTKCALLLKDEPKLIPNKGFRYYVDAIFSNPTPKCPNPLPTAKVHFFIHIPELMPKHYPVMTTYCFEGFKSIFFATGHKQVRSLEFQRFFIDTILYTKLNFYAELFRCRFPNEKEPKGIIQDTDDDSQYVCEESWMPNEEETEESVVEEFDILDKTDL